MRTIRKNYLYQLTVMPNFFPVNCYLVEEEDGLTLIDASLGFAAKGIIEAAATIGKPITRIMLTHVHEDHVGALDAIKEQLPDVPVYVAEREHRLLTGDFSLDSGEDQAPIKGVPKKVQTRADILVKEGDLIGSLQAIATPGHTVGSMSFLDTRTNAVIVGDAFQTRAGMAVAGDIRILFPFPALATWSKQTAIRSAQKLADLNPTLLATGHGEMVEHPVPQMTTAIRRLEGKMA